MPSGPRPPTNGAVTVVGVIAGAYAISAWLVSTSWLWFDPEGRLVWGGVYVIWVGLLGYSFWRTPAARLWLIPAALLAAYGFHVRVIGPGRCFLTEACVF